MLAAKVCSCSLPNRRAQLYSEIAGSWGVCSHFARCWKEIAQCDTALSKYEEVFDKHLEDGIIEEIIVSHFSYDDYTWLSHRPVIRTDEQVTTKTRPVFSCSLKTNKELPSLNKAAYIGIALMGSILKLLFYFRTNEYVMLSDIKQAFLMVKLADEYDKNRFCFFWKRGNKLVCYRYKTIVFGYTSSPFNLNYVMKRHAKSYPEDKCREILDNNFYVDNLVVTGYNIDEYQECKREGLH